MSQDKSDGFCVYAMVLVNWRVRGCRYAKKEWKSVDTKRVMILIDFIVWFRNAFVPLMDFLSREFIVYLSINGNFGFNTKDQVVFPTFALIFYNKFIYSI